MVEGFTVDLSEFFMHRGGQNERLQAEEEEETLSWCEAGERVFSMISVSSSVPPRPAALPLVRLVFSLTLKPGVSCLSGRQGASL